jgi:fluoride ion exporter CrcB/FEX
MAEKALSLPLTTRDRHRGDLPHLQLTLAWGCVAECIVSILCPVSIVGVLDLSATALNVIGPFIAGAVHAFDESLNDTRWHRYCAAFQAGFVGVFTSYTFMAEQSATLTASHGLLYGGVYVVASMAAGCLSFRAGGVALRRLNVLLRGERTARPPSLASARALVRQLCAVVLLFWVWVVLGPAGMVHDPMIFGPDSAWERRAVSKWEDVRQLALGMLWLVRPPPPPPPPPAAPPPRRPAAPPPRRPAAPPPRRPAAPPPCAALPRRCTAPSSHPPPPRPPLPRADGAASARRAPACTCRAWWVAALRAARRSGGAPCSGARCVPTCSAARCSCCCAPPSGLASHRTTPSPPPNCAPRAAAPSPPLTWSGLGLRLGLGLGLRTSGCGTLSTSNPNPNPNP